MYRADSGKVVGETDLLLRKLVEAEIDSMAVANQLEALKETVGKGKVCFNNKNILIYNWLCIVGRILCCV